MGRTTREPRPRSGRRTGVRLHPAPLLVAVLLLAIAGCGDGETASTDGRRTTTTEGAQRDDPLDGRTFVATAVAEDDAARPLVAGTELRIAFEGGQIRVDAGCNQLSAGYRLSGVDLTVEPVAGTEMGCDPERMDQDAWIAAFLAEPLTMTLTEDALTLTSPTAEVALVDREVASPDVGLAGPEWTLDTLLDGETAGSVPAGVTASLTFAADGTYGVAAGCNSGSGTYSEQGATLTVEPPTLTRMRCADDVMIVEAAVLAVLDGRVTVEIEERRLTLTRGDQGLGFLAP